MKCKRCKKNEKQHGNICEQCHRDDVNKRYKINRSKHNKRRNELRNEAKYELVKLSGGKCLRCGYELNKINSSAFDFHHLDPNEKDYTVGNSFVSRMSLESALLEIKKCILLCANCHRIEHSTLYRLLYTVTVTL